VQPDQREDRARRDEHVQRVEARERVAPDLGAALQICAMNVADERPVAVMFMPTTSPSRRSGRTAAGSREALEHPEDQEQDADDPVQLARVLVGAVQETRAMWKNSRMMKTLRPSGASRARASRR
jgi:hypothetical protein